MAALFVLGASGAVYTGFYLKRISLAGSLRSKASRGVGMGLVPKLMLGFQFFISIGMIVASLLVSRQVRYLRNTPLGFNPKNVLVVELPQGIHAAAGDKYLKHELGADPDILMLSLCGSNSLPGEYTSIDVMEYQERKVLVKKAIDNISVDANYLPLLQIPLLAGTGFEDKAENDSNGHVIVTALFARNAGWNQAVGQTIFQPGETDQVIGVAPDFHFSSFHNPIAPMLIFQDPSDPAYLLIRMGDHTSAAVIARLQLAWKKAFPQFPVSYFFLDQHLLQQYKDEENLFKLLLTLSLLSIGISCIGLVAYTSYIIRIAIFDIAVRRVLGASFEDIFKLFGRQFAVLLGIAFLAAFPVSWYLIGKWLNQFSYHENLKLTDYFVALGLMAGIVSVVILASVRLR